MFRLWSVVLGTVLCCSCANPDIWVPTQRQIDDMSYDEAALWLETNLPPLTAVVTTDAIAGVRAVAIRATVAGLLVTWLLRGWERTNNN